MSVITLLTLILLRLVYGAITDDLDVLLFTPVYSIYTLTFCAFISIADWSKQNRPTVYLPV